MWREQAGTSGTAWLWALLAWQAFHASNDDLLVSLAYKRHQGRYCHVLCVGVLRDALF